MTVDVLNKSELTLVTQEFLRCCGSTRWAEKMTAKLPYLNEEELFRNADEIWWALSEEDWREAFTHHPKIGDIESITKKYAATSDWASGEQRAVNSASKGVLLGLFEGNSRYEEKFGFIFIICATGKSAAEMLVILDERFRNSTSEEIRIAASEQAKITRIRLEKLLASE